MEATATEVLRKLQEATATRVKVAATDIDGVLRGKYLNKARIEDALRGDLGLCNGVFGWDIADQLYDNGEYTGWHTGFPDVRMRIDPATFRTIPWEGTVPFLLADFADEAGRPLPICPRNALKRVLARARQLGLHVRCGMEFEWFNFAETPAALAARDFRDPAPLSPGLFGYSMLRTSQQQAFCEALFEQLQQFDIPLEGLHTENGPGLFEAAILYDDALRTADRATLFKAAVKEIAHRFGIMPSFMAKWDMRYQGCSGHIHQSLRGEDGEHLCHDPAGAHGMSRIFRSYVAGQLRCLGEFLVLFAPTINSYKRLVDGFWAPVTASWGVDDRTVSLRVIPGTAHSTRLETRNPGADVNPYLAIAGCIAAGLYGIEHELELPASLTPRQRASGEGAARLPRTLAEATARFAASPLAREYLGDAFVDHYVRTREWEWRQFLGCVTDWERRRYFESV